MRWLRPAFSRRFATLWLIAGVNVILIALYLWSRGGAVTEVRIEAVGSSYRAFVDGKLVVEASFEGRSEGGIGFRLPRDGLIPSLPGPSGIDSVRVTDFTTGEVIFEDTFGGSPSDLWTAGPGDWHVSDGVFSTSTAGVVTTGPRPWRDYVVEAKLRNVSDASVFVRVEDSSNTVAFKVRPFYDYDYYLALIDDGKRVETEGGARLELDRGQTLRSIAGMLLRWYPTAVLMVLGVIVVALAVRSAWLERWLLKAGRAVLRQANFLILGLTLAAFMLLWYLNYVVGEAIPHVPDSVLYIFQGKIFASFRLVGDAPPVREAFSIFNPHFLQVADGRWFSHYPFGHPLVLAVGLRAGAVWLVPPALGAASAYLIYRVGHHIYGTAVGLLAAILLFFSPFFQMTASNFMSHNTAVFYLLASLFFLVRPTKRRPLSMFFSGVFLGLLFNTRPLQAVAFIPVLGLFMAYEFLRAGPKRRWLVREYAAFAAGALLLLLAYFLYNQATTGSFTQSPYALGGTYSSNAFGFGGIHSIARGLQNQQILLAFMVLVANGWPLAIGLSFAALPFMLGTRNRWDYFLAASLLAMAVAAIFFVNAAVMHGPRFWYETMPFLMLLTARGAHRLTEVGPLIAHRVTWRIGRAPPATTAGVTALAVYGLVAALIAFSAYGWMLGKHDAWKIRFVPQKISALEGFNDIHPRLLDRAEEMDIENALVLVKRCPNWHCFGSVFWTNSPDLDNDVVWAEEQGTADDLILLEHFRGRNLYRADYRTGSIEPVTEAEVVRGIEEPRTKATPVPPSIDTRTPAERDRIRRQDLQVLQDALERYAEQTGSYPDTRKQVQTVCVYRNLDRACALKVVLPKLPTDPLGAPGSNGYWYASDGSSFLLIAQQEEMKTDEASCPAKVPRPARAVSLYCVRGPAP